MPRRPDLARFAEDRIEQLAAHALALEFLIAAEPLVPPRSPDERTAWEDRMKTHRASLRLVISELAQLAVVARYAAGEAAEGSLHAP